MTADLLLTGGTGFVGGGILLEALQKGYRVRLAIRSPASKEKILNAAVIREHGFADQLTFVEVPDIQPPDAYTEAVKDVEYVIHLASPSPHPELAETDLKETMVNPAVQGTTNILKAALTNPKLKRVIMTCSVAGNCITEDPNKTSTPYTREPTPAYPDLMSAYQAAKHAALEVSDTFMAEHKPHFDLINIFPGFIFGPHKFATNPGELLHSSNIVAFLPVLQGPLPMSLAGVSTHIEDAARLHIEALKLPGKENRGFGIFVKFDPNDVFGILQKHFPPVVEAGVFKQPPAPQQFYNLNWDNSDTEKVFGMKFKSLEEQIVDTAQQFLALQPKA